MSGSLDYITNEAEAIVADLSKAARPEEVEACAFRALELVRLIAEVDG